MRAEVGVLHFKSPSIIQPSLFCTPPPLPPARCGIASPHAFRSVFRVYEKWCSSLPPPAKWQNTLEGKSRHNDRCHFPWNPHPSIKMFPLSGSWVWQNNAIFLMTIAERAGGRSRAQAWPQCRPIITIIGCRGSLRQNCTHQQYKAYF